MKRTILLITSLVFFLFTACEESDTTPAEGNIFILGGDLVSTNFADNYYWLNGNKRLISMADENFTALNMGVRNSQFYAVGQRFINGSTTITYWNGQFNDIESPTNATANGIYFDGNDIYIQGRISNGQIRTPVYWKNGVRTDLPAPNDGASLIEMVVSNGTVHVVGVSESSSGSMPRTPYYWFNGELEELETNQLVDIYIRDMTLYDGNVYILGDGYDSQNNQQMHILWVNGEANLYPAAGRDQQDFQRASANRLSIDNGDIYFSGNYETSDHSRSYYYKNGSIIMLEIDSNRSTSVSDIEVTNGNVHLIGHESSGLFTTDRTAKYWLNGSSQNVDIADNSFFFRIGIQ
ncbi:hypothetical protein [Roseivirga misakiensis]|uniref:Uncharacterized protein n=1 Tax=Roseivirga misakiensis TaxID=1563681 RepID=A0A1E5SZ41_9BACT|nr:hypothetical protein [Roseivirga misakiensis]OEK04399.1 hypothetical protein BFP71_13035 [Roseivirga misakiensis]